MLDWVRVLESVLKRALEWVAASAWGSGQWRARKMVLAWVEVMDSELETQLVRMTGCTGAARQKNQMQLRDIDAPLFRHSKSENIADTPH
jgi:hypothetical protein